MPVKVEPEVWSDANDPKDKAVLSLYRYARLFVEKLNVIHEDSDFQAVWSLAQSHGGYKGPQYADEFKKLSEAVKAIEEQNSKLKERVDRENEVTNMVKELSEDNDELGHNILWMLTAFPMCGVDCLIEQLEEVKEQRAQGKAWDEIFEAADKEMTRAAREAKAQEQ